MPLTLRAPHRWATRGVKLNWPPVLPPWFAPPPALRLHGADVLPVAGAPAGSAPPAARRPESAAVTPLGGGNAAARIGVPLLIMSTSVALPLLSSGSGILAPTASSAASYDTVPAHVLAAMRQQVRALGCADAWAAPPHAHVATSAPGAADAGTVPAHVLATMRRRAAAEVTEEALHPRLGPSQPQAPLNPPQARPQAAAGSDSGSEASASGGEQEGQKSLYVRAGVWVKQLASGDAE